MSSLLGQIKEALACFAGLKTPPALIGGLALASHGVVRATRDVDFLVDADKANAGQLDMDEMRRYFALFDREDLLEALKDGR